MRKQMTTPPVRARARAFTLLEAILVCCIIAGLIAVLMASARPRVRICHVLCSNNLKQITLALKQWSLDNEDRYPMQVPVAEGGTRELLETGKAFPHFLVLSNELNTPRVLRCPEDLRRNSATGFDSRFSDLNLSYFVGLDAEESRPQMLLVGDAHFTLAGKPVRPGLQRLGTNAPLAWPRPIRKRHEPGGFIGLADGSVSGYNDQGFRNLLRQSGDPTNRLAIP